MPEVRRIYRVNSVSVEDFNFILGLIADRLDELEGYRGKGDFKTVPSSSQEASASTDLARFGQVISVTEVDSRVAVVLGQTQVTLSANTLKIYAQDSPTTILHGFGNVGPGVS